MNSQADHDRQGLRVATVGTASLKPDRYVSRATGTLTGSYRSSGISLEDTPGVKHTHQDRLPGTLRVLLGKA